MVTKSRILINHYLKRKKLLLLTQKKVIKMKIITIKELVVLMVNLLQNNGVSIHHGNLISKLFTIILVSNMLIGYFFRII
jgi:hypothetical protein